MLRKEWTHLEIFLFLFALVDCHFEIVAGKDYKGLLRKYNRIRVEMHAPKI